MVSRLLRNRVSAQQARERKKAYLNDLETRVKELEKRNSELEERLSTLQNENQMLRHVCHNPITFFHDHVTSSLLSCHIVHINFFTTFWVCHGFMSLQIMKLYN